MNKHVKITQSEPADLSRRSFLVGSAAAGLALGYSGVPGLLGADPDRFLAAWSRHDVSRYTEPIEDCFGAMCTELGVVDLARIDAALAFRREHLRRLLVPRPDALSTVEALRDRGLEVGMISNASSEMSQLWAESTLADAFDAVLFSADERMMKPDRRLYERMAVLLGVSTEDAEGREYVKIVDEA